MEWFLPSPLTDYTEVVIALDACLTASSPDEIQEVLKEHQYALLSENTSLVLCLTLARERLQGDTQTIEELLGLLCFVENVHQHGMDQALQRFVDEEPCTLLPSRYIELLDNALSMIEQVTLPYLWAELHSMRADSYMHYWQVERQEAYREQALHDYTSALTVFTTETLPDGYIRNHTRRGLAHLEHPQGDMAMQHIEQAIEDFDCALSLLTPERRPQDDAYIHDWAYIHMMRGLTYIDRVNGERNDNFEQAIADLSAALTFYTHEDFPETWALLHMNRGHAFLHTTRLERAEKLEQAIADFDAAVSVFTQQGAPQEWAATLKDRASAYVERVNEGRQQNLKQAVADYEAALLVYTLDAASQEYCEIQSALTQLYLHLQQPDQAEQAHETLRQAVHSYVQHVPPDADETSNGATADEDQSSSDPETLVSLIDTLLATSNWLEILDLVKRHQHLLLSPKAISLLADKVAEAEKTSSDESSEYLRMYLHLLEDACELSIESAWQRFTSNYLDTIHTLQTLSIAHPSFEDLARQINSEPEKFLTTSMLALMYSTLEGYRASGNVATSALENILPRLISAKKRIQAAKEPPLEQRTAIDDEQPAHTRTRIYQEPPQSQTPDKGWFAQELQRAGFSFPEGIVNDFRYDDPFMSLLMQDMMKLNREQVAAFLPHLGQMSSILKSPELTGLAESSTLLLQIVKREQTPYLWAMLHYNRVIAYIKTPHKNNQQALIDCNNVLSVCTRGITPQMWTFTHFARGSVLMQPFFDGPSTFVHQEEQRQHLQQAIADFDNALTFFTRERMPLYWAQAIGTRGFAYAQLGHITGVVTEYIEKARADFDAALSVLNRENSPIERAAIYMNRGLMYMHLTTGDRKQHIEHSISDCTIALSLFPSSLSLNQSMTWASVLMVRGLAYLERSAGERKENVELALADFESGLTVFTREHSPQEWARAMMNRGLAYMSRLMGERRQNFELALADYSRALTIFTKEETPSAWVRTLTNRGICYMDRVAGDRVKNQESALADFNTALAAFHEEDRHFERGVVLSSRGTFYLLRLAGERLKNFLQARDDFNKALACLSLTETPQYWAKARLNRGMAYAELAWSIGLEYRGWGFRAFMSNMLSQEQLSSLPGFSESEHNSELALEDIDAALTVFTRESTPLEWATAMRERAQIYAYRLTAHFTGKRVSYVQQAIDDFSAALTVLTPESTPIEWAIIHSNRALLYKRLIEENQPEKAELALADIEMAMTIFTREVAPAKHRRLVDIRASVFEHLGRWEEAHTALLMAREVQRDLVATSSSATRPDSIAEFALADTYLRDALAMLHLDHPDMAEVAIALEEGRSQALRAALDLDTIMIERISDLQVQQRAKTFLSARNRWRKCQHLMLERSTALDASLKAIRSHDLQTAHTAFLVAREEIRKHDNPDFMTPVPTLTSIARALHGPDEALVYLVAESSLDEKRGMAIIVTQDTGTTSPITHVHLPDLTEIRIFDLFELEENTYPKIRVQEAIKRLGALALEKLAQELYQLGLRKVTLITYGWLSLFPLSSALVTHPNGCKQPLGEIFEVTFAPSARAVSLASEQAHHSRRQRPHLLMAGDPKPVPAHVAPLPFAAAEAETTQRIAKAFGYPSTHIRYLKPREATRGNVVVALRQAWYAHLAIHGLYRADDPPRSHLLLAGPEKDRYIYLHEALDGTINLSGLRLLVLSACETAIVDMRRTPDEMVGLAAGFLQAGVAGVLASLWPVDDHATYLLMSRFAQLYLDPQGIWSPARALARAQQWLREEATYSVLATYDPELVEKINDVMDMEPREGSKYAGRSRVTLPSQLRSLRRAHEKAMREIHLNAAFRAMETPDELPYKDAEYWAAFIVTGC